MTIEQEKQLIELIKNDPTYQELLRNCGKLEKEYFRILCTLDEEDKILLDKYIGICEEMEHQKVLMAFSIG